MSSDNDDDAPQVSRSRGRRERVQSKTKAHKMSAMEKLRQARKYGEKNNYEPQKEDLFEEVTEEEYSKRVLERQDDDFVEDDGSGLYRDDGRDLLDQEADQEDYEVSESTSKKKKNRPATKSSTADRTANSGLHKFFSTGAKSKDEKKLTTESNSILNDMLSELHSDLTEGPKIIKPVPVASTSRQQPTSAASVRNPFSLGSTGPGPVVDSGVRPAKRSAQSPLKQPVVQSDQKQPRHDVASADVDSFMADDDDFDEPLTSQEPAGCEPSSSGSSLQAQIKQEPVPAQAKMESQQPFNSFEFGSSSAAPQSPVVKLDSSELPLVDVNGESCLPMYWLDAYEDPFKQPGTVHLFGRVHVPKCNAHVSCCVTLKNIDRVVYFLPRPTRHLRGADTGEPVSLKQVYDEVQRVLMDKYKVAEIKSKKTTLSYALDETDVPSEADYLEVRYPASCAQLPATLKGDTFSHVFNTTATSLELLLMDRRLRGPSWIYVKNPVAQSAPISWCQLCVRVDASRLSVIEHMPQADRPAQTPPIAITALQPVFITNPKTKQPEIVSVAVLHHSAVHMDLPLPKPAFNEHYCFLTKPANEVFPFDLRDKLAKQGMNTVVTAANERALLSLLLAKLNKLDPDIIVGHDLFSPSIDVLISRLGALKVPNWSRISRLRRHGPVPRAATSAGSKYIRAECSAGRVLLDSRVAAMELVRARSYELGPLAAQILSANRLQRTEHEIRAAYQNSNELLVMVRWCLNDADLSLRLVAELSALPLFLQITQIVGGVMSKTTMGGRAERNEYLLLHAFNEKRQICPDKVAGKKRPQQNKAAAAGDEADENEAPAAGQTNSKRKPQYSGGLVLEPVKGLYDTFILLLDFNSLYPSIIQEFNICFTTVDRQSVAQSEEGIPELPRAGLEPGILPTEIRKLVESRREVKKLMKEPTISSEQAMQYNIRQLALKLTANSMYGCLGFGSSRFHAQPLAALITYKGREILTHTKELVEKTGLSVIYGDTDSIMINTNSRNYNEVIQLGKKVKAEVNKMYRLLELDIDGVYRTLLLLKKKKYAGLSYEVLPNGQVRTTREMKGLDIVRRDWSTISKQVGESILSEILSDGSRDDIVDAIHQHLLDVAEQISANTIPLEKYEISKSLTKAPTEYGDKNSQPHVSVALRCNEKYGTHYKQGDTVDYIICQDGTNNPAVQRAYHRREMADREELTIDTHYYLSQQIHPVVSRICEPIEGTDAARIASCLGLDASAYKQRNAGGAGHSGGLCAMDDDDDDRAHALHTDFTECQPFTFTCFNPQCEQTIEISAPFVGQSSSIDFSVSRCPFCQLHLSRSSERLVQLLCRQIRKYCMDYARQELSCEDRTCGFAGRRQPIALSDGRPVCPACKNSYLRKTVSERSLLNQLTYFKRMFDAERALKKCSAEEKRKLNTNAACVQAKGCMLSLHSLVDAECARSAYSHVKLDFLANMAPSNQQVA